jgi:hypothetical protein
MEDIREFRDAVRRVVPRSVFARNKRVKYKITGRYNVRYISPPKYVIKSRYNVMFARNTIR